MTLAEINPLAELADGSFVALDAHMEMENEAVGRQKALLRKQLEIAEDDTRETYEPSDFERNVAAIDAADHRGVIQGKDHGFDGNLGLVIGAGGGSLTLTDAVRSQGGKPANYSEIGGNPSVAKACGLAKEVLEKDGVEKIAVMMSIVSNTRVDIVARGVIKACLELGKDPGETIAIFRIPGAWEEEGFKILDRYGVEYCDRSVSMWEAAGRAVAKIQGAPHDDLATHPRYGTPPGGPMSILLTRTTFIVQGITGREAVNLTRECLDYGSKVVGGVTPGRKGREVHGVPVFDTVAQAVENHGGPIDGSVVTVPPAFTKDAVLEAIENGIKLIVIVTERIPRRDVAQMVELADMRGARIIGPNCLGLIVPEVCKMGGIGGPAKDAAKAYAPGPVGVMSRSGGMTTEISSSLTQAGLGVSTAVSIGGDAIIGSTYAELMPYFEADEQTQAIVIYTEPGGRMEAQLSEWVDGERQPPADRRLHGRQVHGRRGDEGDELRPRRHDRRGQGGHRDREDRPPRSGRHPRRRADRRDPRRGQGEAGGGRLMAETLSKVFIDVEVDASVAGDAELAAKLEEVCPVDIFKATEAGVEIVEENLDECVLCNLCVDAAPAGTVHVVKLYER